MRCSRSTADEAVLDVGDVRFGGDVLVARGVARVLARDAAGLAVERGGEEERLALRRALLDDPVDRRAEAHVEHAVRLVEHEGADAVERERAARDQVLEAAGSGDDDVRLAGLAGLLLDADAAVDGADRSAARMGDRAPLLDDLRASSRVGASTSAAGRGSVGLDAVGIGTPKASVLPEPVGDLARTSRPASTSAMTSFWMANGS